MRDCSSDRSGNGGEGVSVRGKMALSATIGRISAECVNLRAAGEHVRCGGNRVFVNALEMSVEHPLELNMSRKMNGNAVAVVIGLVAGTMLAIAPMAAAQGRDGGNAAQGAKAADVAQAERAAGLNLSRVVLYRSGVGYFQRTGTVSNDAKLSMPFDVSQINDVIKSLQVLDLDGGRVDSVSYPTKDPISRRLGSFALQIGDNPSIPSLLSRLRGSMVTLMTADAPVRGTVLSVETREVPQGGGGAGGGAPAVIDTAVVNILTEKGIRSVQVPTITSFEIEDKDLAADLNRALMALAESRAERTKTLDITLSGQGERRVAVGYVHETPVWKTSYRMILPESDAKAGGASTGVMQGWAIVENTTDQDWTNVRLALVSGRPVSFQMDLYEPLYMGRPLVAVPTIPGVSPRVFELAVNNMEAGLPPTGDPGSGTTGSPFRMIAPAPAVASDAAPMRMARAGAPGSPGSGGGGEAGRDRAGYAGFDVRAQNMSDYAPKAQATAGEVGEIFQFEMNTPVTIERQRSAMIPFLTTNVDARRVSIFNQSDRADHPMRGVEIRNTSDLQLLPGPMSVFDGASYAGDAQIGQIAPGDKRLLAYAVDLDVAVTVRNAGDRTVRQLKIVLGTVQQSVASVSDVTYTFDNKDLKRGREIIAEHPRLDGWDLKAPAKADEQTQSMYRFRLDVPAGKSASLTVRQERTDLETLGIFDFSRETLMAYQKEGKISPAVMALFEELARLRGAVEAQDRVITQIDQEVEKLRKDQTRVSGMLGTLDRNTDTYRNLLTKMNRQESEIDSMVARRVTEQTKLEQARATLENAVRTANAQ